jgi:hypothetical protein
METHWAMSQPLTTSSPSAPLAPNARFQPRLEAGARHERTLEGVGWTRWLGLACKSPHYLRTHSIT